jgi:hypothetical protein
MLETLRIMVWPVVIAAIAVGVLRLLRMRWVRALDNSLRIADCEGRVKFLQDEARLFQAGLKAQMKTINSVIDRFKQLESAAVDSGAARIEALERLSKRLEAVEAVARAAGEARQPPARRV